MVNVIYCARCNVEMKLGVLPTYEFEEGYVLQNIHAYKCLKCHNVFFTEEQAKKMNMLTSKLKKEEFGFERKITVSGKSLVVGIPIELAEHLHIKQGQKVKIIPGKEGFMIKTMV
ncbi:MAG TPA: AbrB/MazE/SpoVT family DNA-binding domain-containing protein [Candidatus Nanoarchaeia archaeon]|nr:AbrB/MazE/SpoVT family DNA-binding domain-containing protein [Candidatus Nanoarchaeia archaeon]